MTTREQRKERVEKYFVPDPENPTKAYIQLGAGVVLLVLGIAIQNACVTTLFVIAALVLGFRGLRGVLRYLRDNALANPKATDAEMDQYVQEALEPVVRTGVQRLNVHPGELGSGEREPQLVFTGIPQGEVPFLVAFGKDGRLRYSRVKIMVVYLSDWRLPVYECVLDLATGATVTDNTKEYNLNQVDGMESLSDRVNVFDQAGGAAVSAADQVKKALGHVTSRQMIKLSVSGRVAVTLVMRIAPEDSMVVEGLDPRNSVDRLISQLREHLRTRSGGAVHGNPNLVAGPPQQYGIGAPPQQYGPPGLPAGSYPPPGYPPAGYPPPGYPPAGYPPAAYPPAGYPGAPAPGQPGAAGGIDPSMLNPPPTN